MAGLTIGVLASAVESTDDIDGFSHVNRFFLFAPFWQEEMWRTVAAAVYTKREVFGIARAHFRRCQNEDVDDEEDYGHPKHDLWLGEWS